VELCSGKKGGKKMRDVKLPNFRVNGVDPNGIPRVFGYGPTEKDAEYEAREAAREYIKRRPDTEPLCNWTYHPRKEE